MKKLKKFLLIFVAIVMVLVIVGIVYIKIKYPPEKVKIILISKMSEFLRREIEIKNVTVGFTGLKVEGLRISEKPTFKEGSFVEAKQFLIKPNLAAILKKEISINKIILVAPSINITRYKDSSFNFSDLIVAQSTASVKKEKPEKASAAKMEGLPFAFVISKLAITEGNIKFTDKTPQNLSTEIKNINVLLSGISLVKPFFIESSMEILQKNINGFVSLKSSVDIKDQKLKIKEAIVRLPGAGLKISGDIEKFMEPDNILFNVKIRDEKLQIEKLIKVFPVPADLVVSGSPIVDFDISGTVSKIHLKGKVDIKNVDVSFGDIFKKQKNMDAYLSADILVENQDTAKINDISVGLDTIKISAQGLVAGISKNKIRQDIKIVLNKFDLKALSRFIPPIKDFGLSGMVSSDIKIEGDLKLLKVSGLFGVENVQSAQKDFSAKINKTDFVYTIKVVDLKKGEIGFSVDGGTIEIKMPPSGKPDALQTAQSPALPPAKKQPIKGGIPPDFSIDGELKVKNIVFNGYKISDCFAKLNLLNAVFTIKPFSMLMCNGTIAGSLSADFTQLNPEKIKFSFDGTVKNYDLHELLLSTGLKLKGQMWGIADANMKISGVGTDMSGLNGSGWAQLKNVKINGVKILDQLSAVAMMPQLKETSFKSITSKVNIVNGRLDLSNSRTEGGDKLDAYCSGNANLVSMTQDIKGDIKFTRAYSGGDLAKYTADSEGRVTVPFTIGGSFDDPKVSLDWNKIAKTAAKKEAERILMKEGEKLLKGLFSR
ncbi:MAG: AsmA family protein [Elusimicrobia bacterium]|nr:AsmA family protein [Elusimicrobiota bacterium]